MSLIQNLPDVSYTRRGSVIPIFKYFDFSVTFRVLLRRNNSDTNSFPF